MKSLISFATIIVASFIMMIMAAVSCRAAPADPNPRWQPCDFTRPGLAISCMNLSVPLDYAHPNDGSMTIFITQLNATTQPPKGTLMFLNGGSGVGGQCTSGASWLQYMAQNLGLNVILPDMRGAGRSQPRLDCPDDPEGANRPTVACAKYYTEKFGSKGMYNYSISMAAHDVNHIIQKLSSDPSKNNILFSNSFGTFWHERIMQIYPNLFQQHVRDSLDAAPFWRYFDAPKNIAFNVRKIIQYCDGDIHCSGKLGLGIDPVDAYRSILMVQAPAECAKTLAANPPTTTSGTTIRKTSDEWATGLRQIVGALGGAPSRDMMQMVPATLYRIGRCSAADRTALANIFDNFFPATPPPTPQRDTCTISQPVLYNLFLSEGVSQTSPPAKADLIKLWKSFPALTPGFESLADMVDVIEAWPTYTDQYVGKAATGVPASTPVLLINGDVDGSTPWPNAALFSTIEGYTQLTPTTFSSSAPLPARSIVMMPSCPHVAFLMSPLPGTPITCGLKILLGFIVGAITTPPGQNRTLDVSCTDQIIPLDWNSNTMAQALFKTADAWDFTAPVGSTWTAMPPFIAAPAGASCNNNNNGNNNGNNNNNNNTDPLALRTIEEHPKLFLGLFGGSLFLMVVFLFAFLYQLRKKSGGGASEQYELQQG